MEKTMLKKWLKAGYLEQHVPRDAQRDDGKRAIKSFFFEQGKGRETAYIDIYRYKETAKEDVIGEREKPAAWISTYAAGRKPKEWAKVAGKPWMVMVRAGEVGGRAIRVSRSCQERRQ
jgi:hypothetical protein